MKIHEGPIVHTMSTFFFERHLNNSTENIVPMGERLPEVNMADAALELENAIPEMPDMSMEGPQPEVVSHGGGDTNGNPGIFIGNYGIL